MTKCTYLHRNYLTGTNVNYTILENSFERVTFTTGLKKMGFALKKFKFQIPTIDRKRTGR